MNPDDGDPPRLGDGEPEPFDPDDTPLVQFEREDDAPQRAAHTWRFVTAAAVIAVVGLVLGIIVFNASAPDAVRGAASATSAAKEFVSAVNAGNEKAAAAISCDTFVDEAKSAARSGSDSGIAYTLGPVTAGNKTSATAKITERLTLPGGKRQSRLATVSVVRSSGRWLICGRVS